MEYNGHPSYEHWNAALWWFNDEPLYRELMATCDAETFAMNNEGMVTPDGVECTAELLQYVWEEGHAD